MLHGFIPALLEGLQVTLAVAALSLLVACVFGLLGAVAKLSASRALRGCATAYTTVIRGLPELVLMLFVFYGAQIGLNQVSEAMGWGTIDVPPFVAGVLTLGFIYGAYLTETFRGAILAVPRGQAEAAQAFGMRDSQVWLRIVMPQMVRHAIPGFANNWLVMVKATALVSLIGLDDLMHRADLASSATREPFTFYMAAALLYLGITTLSIWALAWLERRFSLGVKSVSF